MISSLMHYTSRVWGRQGEGQGRVRPAGSGGPSRLQREDMPLVDSEFVVFDTELTGLRAKKDSIVSIGAIRMRGDAILLGETFYRLALPRTALTGKSVVIHGITPTEAAAAPGMEALLPEFTAFCGDAVLVGHVVSIDLQFLNREMKELYGRALGNPAADTFKISQWLSERQDDRCAYHGGSPECYDLFSLAKKYHIPVQQAHNALGDAFVTAQLFQRLMRKLSQWGITTQADLLRIGGA